jgi:hypothetical protein
VLVEVRDKGGGIENCRDGDGVSRDREGKAWVFFHAGAQAGANLTERKTSGNLAMRYEFLTVSSSFSKATPSTSDIRPVRSPSCSISSRKFVYSVFEGQPKKIWWQWQL